MQPNKNDRQESAEDVMSQKCLKKLPLTGWQLRPPVQAPPSEAKLQHWGAGVS